MNIQELLNVLPPVQSHLKKLVIEQDVPDIIQGICRMHRSRKSDYDQLYEKFWTGDVYGTCEKIWNFEKSKIPYIEEPEKLQTVKSPAAILTRNLDIGGTDCKHYALFTGGIIDAINRNVQPLNWVYRFVSYNNRNKAHHVFVVVLDREGEIWIDPVMDRFDDRTRQPEYKKDVFCGSAKKKIGMLAEVTGRSVKGLSTPQAIPAFQSWGALLALVQANQYGLADTLANLFPADWQKISKIIAPFGANVQVLKRYVSNAGKTIGSGFADHYVPSLNLLAGVDPGTMFYEAIPFLRLLGPWVRNNKVIVTQAENYGASIGTLTPAETTIDTGAGIAASFVPVVGPILAQVLPAGLAAVESLFGGSSSNASTRLPNGLSALQWLNICRVYFQGSYFVQNAAGVVYRGNNTQGSGFNAVSSSFLASIPPNSIPASLINAPLPAPVGMENSSTPVYPSMNTAGQPSNALPGTVASSVTSILSGTLLGLPNVVWIGGAVGAAFLLSRKKG